MSQQDEKSQIKNRAKALKVLRNAALRDRDAASSRTPSPRSAADRSGTGDRSEKIRTYNFPQSRITDHRINFTTHQLHGVLDGNLDELIDALTTFYTAEKLPDATDRVTPVSLRPPAPDCRQGPAWSRAGIETVRGGA